MNIAISLLALTIPYLWEIVNDRNGESYKEKVKDIIIRIFLAVLASLVGWYFIGANPIKGVFLSLAFHWLLFDYTITTVLIKRGVIETKESAFSYVGKTSAMDKNKFWVKLGGWGRFIVRLIVFGVATIIYLQQ